jgi:hypothetical protein
MCKIVRNAIVATKEAAPLRGSRGGKVEESRNVQHVPAVAAILQPFTAKPSSPRPD